MTRIVFNTRLSDAPATQLGAAGFAAAERGIVAWPGYARTPLHSLPALARFTHVASIAYKDEGSRFGLGSFKALGGAYAVLRVIQAHIARKAGVEVSSSALMAGAHANLAQEVTVVCATDGNHGRSVAWGAKLFGCRAVIYLHENVSAHRAGAIAHYGARVVRVPGNYDDSVRQAAADARDHGHIVVSDTSYEGYTQIPREVMYGYGVTAGEALAQLPAPPTHLFLQAGVGAFAASIIAYADNHLPHRPVIVVAEPERAACVYDSLGAGAMRTVEGALDTIMAGLACGEVSLIAWDILKHRAAAGMLVSDSEAEAAMRLLAAGEGGDPKIVAGESAVAGLCGFLVAARDPEVCARLGIDAQSRILVFGTEGATDPELYARIVNAP